MNIEISPKYHSSFISSSKIVLTLAIPVIIENVLQVLLGTTDTYFASKLGSGAIAAIGIVNLLMNVFIAFFTAICIGSTAVISRYIGNNNYDMAKLTIKQSIIIATIFGIALGLISGALSKPLLLLMGAENDILIYAVPYFRLVGIPCVFLSLMLVLSSCLRSVGDTKTPMVAAIISNILNILLNYILIFGIFNFKGLGIVGAGIATSLSRLIGVIILMWKFYTCNLPVSFTLSDSWHLDKSILTSIITIGIPAGIEKLFMRFGQMIYGTLIISLGTTSYVAHSIAGTIESYSYLPAMGFGVAAATLVGQSLGSKDFKKAQQYGLIANFLSTIIMVFMGIIFFIFAPNLAEIFTNDIKIQSLVVKVLRIIALFQPLLSITNVISSALQGAGDTKFPMYSTLIGIWFFRVAFGYIFAIIFNLGLIGIWLAYALDTTVRGILLMIRFNRGKWKHIKI